MLAFVISAGSETDRYVRNIDSGIIFESYAIPDNGKCLINLLREWRCLLVVAA